MRLVRYVVAAGIAVAATTTATPAWAAAPSNDTYAGRTVVAALPFPQTLDTTEATTDTDDVEINTDCGAPATDASVWYEFTASTDGGLVVDVSGSDYSAGAIVASGSPGSWVIENCAPGAVGWFATAGQTYTILAFDDQFDGGGNGGTLAITIDVAPPPPSIDITVNPTGGFTKAGAAIISGTVTCTGVADFASVEAEVRQAVGRVATVRGFGFFETGCNGTTEPWTIEVLPDSGLFRGGKAVSITFAFACGPFDCGVDFEERTVTLRGTK